jgi:hypothetical protein
LTRYDHGTITFLSQQSPSAEEPKGGMAGANAFQKPISAPELFPVGPSFGSNPQRLGEPWQITSAMPTHGTNPARGSRIASG